MRLMDIDRERSPALQALNALLTSARKTALRKTTRDVFIVAVVSVLFALVASGLGAPPPWLAPALACAALCLALMCATRLQLVEFSPEVLGGDVILPPASRPNGAARLLLPLQFVNSGSIDGVIQWVALRLTIDEDSKHCVLLSPVAEVDMQRFIQAKRRLDNEQSLEPFTAFPLEGKRSVAKFVLFDLAERGRTAPLHIAPGRYSFELFVKSTATRGPKLERTFTHVIDAKQIEQYRSDSTVYLIDYQVTLPGVRREFGGGEWLPRAARYSS
jgi:hypothetical protein